MTLGVSVVICCHNSARRLPETLGHLARQKVSAQVPWEIIVIDNASSDDTAAVASSSWPKDAPCPLRVLAEPQAGLCYARIRGIREARYGIISFLDDDNWAAENWIARVGSTFADHPKVGASGGRVEAQFEITPPPWFASIEGYYAVGRQHARSGDVTDEPGTLLFGAGLSLRAVAARELLDRGFTFLMSGREGSSLLSGEDTELCYALREQGWRFWYDNDLVLRHFMARERLTWAYARRLMYGMGQASVYLDLYLLALRRPPYQAHPAWKKTWLFQVLKTLKEGGSVLLSHFLECLTQPEGSAAALRFRSVQGRLHRLRKISVRYRSLIDCVTGAEWRRPVNEDPERSPPRLAPMHLFPWFDCLRCFAVLLVICHHSPNIDAQLPPGLSQIFGQIRLIGWVGVDLFFVLSGFLVSGLLFQEYDLAHTLDIKRFLIRRAFKIFPGFYLLTVVTCAFQIYTTGHIYKTNLLHDIFFLQSYLAGSWPHAWTLAVEVHFYILLAILLYFLSRGSRRNWVRPLPWIIGAVLVLDPILRLVHFYRLPASANPLFGFQQTHLHIDVLAAGVLLRYLYNYHRSALEIFRRGWPLWLGASFLLVYPSTFLHTPHPFYLTALMPTWNWMAFFVILFLTTLLPFPQSGFIKRLVLPFDYAGKHSYGIYLWHMPVQVWIIDRFVPRADWLHVLCFFLGSIVVGCFFSEVLEMPMLHLRNKLFPSKAQKQSK